MTKKYKYSSAEAQLQPVALTVIFTSLAVAAVLIGTVSMGIQPELAGAYQISAER